ncbi:hypothetical protein AcW1_006465 [Taiwanofungus camphoratus]|nr:hypothetical protein AcV5_009049 [Antrodia cinnamomea]KAI0924314.1 hypothetical protein AcW2_005227 [Antrodia cinnamomea]KAI0954640.1 hypothetical protein AcW1_006465 [Antrodia cinnamomea]
MAGNAPVGNGHAPTDASSTHLSWDGDRMFNIYIYDYCTKRGFAKTARELVHEADIPPESQPPINAKQGLLFEWWSVFWVLFTAKSSGTGTEDAVLYTQHQTQQAVQRQAQPPRSQQQQANRGYPNGVSRQGAMPSGASMPNGAGPNGIPMPNGTHGNVSFQGSMPQTNGIPAPPSATNTGGVASTQPQNIQQLGPGQRGGPPQRGPNGVAPFQSPTMAHSPQNPSTIGQQMGQIGASQPLTQMNRGGMLPPNGLQGSLGPNQQTPQPAFQQLGRSPSQPGSPGQSGMMTAPSPSMSARQPPGMSSGDIRQMQESSLNTDIFRLSAGVLNQLKQEAGLGDKDLPSLTSEEKQRIMNMARRKGLVGKLGPQGPTGSSNATAGPSGSNQSMQPPQQRNAQMSQSTPQQQPARPPSQQSQQQQQGQQRGNKRNSTSPGQEHEQLPRNDASPPDRKRVRRSPAGGEHPQPPPMTPMAQFPHGSQQVGPGGPHQMPNGMIGRPMGAFPGQPGMPNMGNNPGMNMQMGPSLGAPQMNNAMNAQMYRQSMHNLYKNNIPPGGLNNLIPGTTAPSPSSDQQFDVSQSRPGTGQFTGGLGGAGPSNRSGQNKPMGMMPPPSPGMKSKNVQNKDGSSGDAPVPSGSIDAPPQAPAAGMGQGQASAAAPGPSTAPPTPSATSTSMTAPSPSAILNNASTPSMNSSHAPAPDIFPQDFIQSVASSFDDFDPSIFRGDNLTDLNFERDFGDWFQTDNVNSL